MEINTEINKVFGIEMAKLFADKISDAELEAKAKETWVKISSPEFDSWGRKSGESKISKYIEEVILKRIYEKIDAILQEPISEELLEQKARDMVNKAREAGEKAIITELAKNMADNVMHVYASNNEIVNEAVHRVLNIERNNNRLY